MDGAQPRFCAPSSRVTPVYMRIGAHVCIAGDYVVILDTASGKYLGIAIAEARGIGPWVVGWPLSDGVTDGESMPPLVRRLLQQGVMTTDASAGQAAVPVSVRMRDVWLGDRRAQTAPALQLAHVGRFLRAVLVAAVSLRCLSLERILSRARRRKRQHRSQAIDPDQLTQLMTVYGRLRPFLYGTENACMLHCMAVLEFLAPYGIVPDWVIGVRAHPFCAHSWLQVDEQVLTDSPLHVCRMTPILFI
ncbi:MAG: lasso peptide biosynthesis B2 protein [Luteimonas sp.]